MDNINQAIDNNGKKMRKPNPIGRFFKMVFVSNFGLKALAIGVSVALWALAVGL